MTGKKSNYLSSEDPTTDQWNRYYFKVSRLDAWTNHREFLLRRRALIRGLLKGGFDVREYANVWRIEVRRELDCFSVDLDEQRQTLHAISITWIPMTEAQERRLPIYIRDIAAQGKELPASSMVGVKSESGWVGVLSNIGAEAGIPGRWGWPSRGCPSL